MTHFRKAAIAFLLVAATMVPVQPASAQQTRQLTDAERAAIIIVSGHTAPGPRPLPTRNLVELGTVIVDPAVAVSLNPQPLPPKTSGVILQVQPRAAGPRR